MGAGAEVRVWAPVTHSLGAMNAIDELRSATTTLGPPFRLVKKVMGIGGHLSIRQVSGTIWTWLLCLRSKTFKPPQGKTITFSRNPYVAILWGALTGYC